jgi:hypothetical protein
VNVVDATAAAVDLVDETVAVLVHTVGVTPFLSPGMDGTVAVVAVPVVGPEAITVVIVTAIQGEVAVLSNIVEAIIGCSRENEGVLVVAILALGRGGHPVTVPVMGRAGQVTVKAVIVETVATDLPQSRPYARIAVVAVIWEGHAIVVQIISKAALIDLAVTVVVHEVVATNCGRRVGGVGADALRGTGMDGRVLVIAVLPTTGTHLVAVAVSIAIAGLVTIVTTNRVDSTVLINPIAADFRRAGMDVRVLIVAVVNAIPVAVQVWAGSVAVEAVRVMAITAAVGSKRIPLGVIGQLVALAGFRRHLGVTEGVAVFHRLVGSG